VGTQALCVLSILTHLKGHKMASIRNIKRWSLQHVAIIQDCYFRMAQDSTTSEEFDELSERIYLNLSIIVKMFGSYYACMMAYLRKHELEDIYEVYEFMH
jgi:hypothetical protein